MAIRQRVEERYRARVEELASSLELDALESGRASREDYDRFVANLVRVHLVSPQALAFLFALAPPASVERVKGNLLEEMGLGGEGSAAHPALLRELACASGLGDQLPRLEEMAREELRARAGAPLRFRTLAEAGLAALVEVVAYEFMLVRLAGRIARALALHRRLRPDALGWLKLHAEVDSRHAEEGLLTIEDYAGHHAIAAEAARAIIDAALPDGYFVARYFAPVKLEPSLAALG
jgi:pyrroloquinoline quinone (PQQ) biosynthesis protein C